MVQITAFVAAAAATLTWLHRAEENARAIGARDMIVSPGWAVGWWFVPLANLAMPFVTVRELWKASARPADWEAEKAPARIGLWWALWLASGIAGAISFQLTLAGDKDMLTAVPVFLLVADAAAVPGALLFASIVGGIDAMQRRHAR